MKQETYINNLDGSLETNIESFYSEMVSKNLIPSNSTLSAEAIHNIKNNVIYDEAMKRDKYISDYISDRISAKIHKKTTDDEHNRVMEIWKFKARIVEEVIGVYNNTFGFNHESMSDCTLVVSLINGSEIRVFINSNEPSHKNNVLLATYYLTGNEFTPPSKFISSLPNSFSLENEAKITKSLRELGSKFRSVCIKFSDTYTINKSTITS